MLALSLSDDDVAGVGGGAVFVDVEDDPVGVLEPDAVGDGVVDELALAFDPNLPIPSPRTAGDM